MARPRKDEVLKGELRACAFCGELKYCPPSHLIYKKNYCNIGCQKKDANNIPCKVCGTAIYVSRTQLLYRARSTCSPLCRKKLRSERTELNRRQKGFSQHQIDRAERYSAKASEWRSQVFDRDNYTCQGCGQHGGYLEADHVMPWAYYPEMRYDILNGRTLCRKCHDKTKVGYKKLKAEFPELKILAEYQKL